MLKTSRKQLTKNFLGTKKSLLKREKQQTGHSRLSSQVQAPKRQLLLLMLLRHFLLTKNFPTPVASLPNKVLTKNLLNPRKRLLKKRKQLTGHSKLCLQVQVPRRQPLLLVLLKHVLLLGHQLVMCCKKMKIFLPMKVFGVFLGLLERIVNLMFPYTAICFQNVSKMYLYHSMNDYFH